MKLFQLLAATIVILAVFAQSSNAQEAPDPAELKAYSGLLRAAADGDSRALETALSQGANIELRDAHGRTPFLVAAYQKQRAMMEALVAKGADPNALEHQKYDAVTIAAVADDVETLKSALALGNRATNITSPYDGTALIAAAHLGHDEVVRLLIEAGAPLNHVNNLGWTALIEAVILGDGGQRHQKTVAYLIKAGADKSIADRGGATPLAHSRQRGYSELIKLLE